MTFAIKSYDVQDVLTINCGVMPLNPPEAAVSEEIQVGVIEQFASPEILLAIVMGLLGGFLCVFRPESVRVFAVRHHPDVPNRFGSAEAHRRFIKVCGWALLALAAASSLFLRVV